MVTDARRRGPANQDYPIGCTSCPRTERQHRTALATPLRQQRSVAVERTGVPGVLVCEGPSQGLIRRLVDERIGWVRPDVWIPTLQDLPDMSRHAHNLKEVTARGYGIRIGCLQQCFRHA